MAFANKIGNLIKHAITSQPSLYQAIRCMSSSKVFVGGLSFGTDNHSLQEAFTNYGQVVEARVIVERETGRSRGFGFVTFTSAEEASKAIAGLNGKDLHGRMVRVDYAIDRTSGPRGSYGGGGGYGSGGYGGGGYSGGNAGGGYGSGGYGGGGYSGGNAGGGYGSGGYGGGGYGGGNAGGGYSGDVYSRDAGGGNAGDAYSGGGGNAGGGVAGDVYTGAGGGDGYSTGGVSIDSHNGGSGGGYGGGISGGGGGGAGYGAAADDIYGSSYNGAAADDVYGSSSNGGNIGSGNISNQSSTAGSFDGGSFKVDEDAPEDYRRA